MRLAKVWRGRSRCKLEKFPHGGKMSATLLIDFLMRARCSSRALSGPFVRVCVQYLGVCVCFKSHLEQIVDSKTRSTAASGQKSVSAIWFSEQLHSGPAKISSCPD